jgi:hypothetical protein
MSPFLVKYIISPKKILVEIFIWGWAEFSLMGGPNNNSALLTSPRLLNPSSQKVQNPPTKFSTTASVVNLPFPFLYPSTIMALLPPASVLQCPHSFS